MPIHRDLARLSGTLLLLLVACPALAFASDPIEVVTTLSAYASIAEEVGGDRVNVQSISRGDEDAHFVKPKPSYALMLRRADLFVTTGLDLELWAPTLVDKSGNRGIRDGEPGYVNASQNVPLLDVPASADRSGGDVHVFGNPHLLTSPLNARIVAQNIAAGLIRVDPQGRSHYLAGLDEFLRLINEALYGAELVELLGAEVLEPLARQNRLLAFLESQELDGKPLVERLGGWLGRARPLHGQTIVAYHKNWIYLTALLGFEVAGYVEPKPGIPPSARHVHQLVEKIKDERIRVLLSASYFKASQVQTIADRTGSMAVRVPMGPVPGGPQSYFELVDLWIDGLVDAFEATGG